jgi:hypothetical protein
LFDQGELDKVISGLSQVSELRTIEDVRSVAGQMGINVVRGVFKWAERNWKSEFSVDVQWTRSDAIAKGEHVPRRQFLKLISLIEQTSDEVPDDIEVAGSLVGLHILSDTFSLATSNGDTYSGRLAQGFHKRQYKVPGVYKAKIRMKTTVKYATESVSVAYELLALEEA